MKQFTKSRIFTATNILIFVNVLVYILDKYLLCWDDCMFTSSGMLNSIIGFCGGDLYLSLCYYDGCLADGEIWRCVTFLFVHLFILHLAVNIVGFYIVGNHVERKYGPIFVIVVFLTIGILNNLVVNNLPFLKNADSVTGGSSGAVFGFIGIAAAQWILEKSTRCEYTKPERYYMALYGVLFTYFVGEWTIFCHNIGFIMGLTLGFMLIKAQKKKEQVENDNG